MNLFYLILPFFWLIRSAQCLVLIDSTIASSCIYYELQFDWGCGSHSNNQKPYACRCGNINWLGTVTNCIMEATDSEHLRLKALKHLATRCQQKAGLNYSLEDMFDIYNNGTKYLRNSTDADLTNPVYDTLIVDKSKFAWYHLKFKQYTVSVRTSQWFGWGLVFFWTFIVTVASFYNLLKRVFGCNVLNNALRRRLVYPSIYKSYKDQTFMLWNWIPFNFQTRLNTLVIAVFLVQTFISVGVGYHLPLPHPYITTAWERNLVLVSYRCDLMSISLFPIIFLFGIRNNPLIKISGIQFPAFSFYHKWCAYVSTSLAFIHAIIWTVYAIKNGGYRSWYLAAYWQWGICAIVIMFIMLMQSEKVIRDRFYESFLVLHKILGVVFIVAMYYHLNTLGWEGWVWSMAGCLIYDRMMRIYRILKNGGIQDANLTDCGSDIIKISIRCPKTQHYPIGSFAYLYFINLHDFWHYSFQSHPFTVMSNPVEDAKNPGHLLFYLKVNKGITRNMLKKIISSGKKSLKCKVMLEGPYGTVLERNTDVTRRHIGVAGGVGISAVYPHMTELVKSSNDGEKKFQHKFYWIINDLSYLDWFNDELVWLKDKGCHVEILYTKQNVDVEVDKTSIPTFEDAEKLLPTSESVQIQNDITYLNGRPDFYEFIHNELNETQNLANDVTFLSCGSSAFNDSFRYQLVRNLRLDWKIDINLEEKSFTW